MSANKSKNAVIDTVKRQVNYGDLPREELLDIIVYLQSELEAREVLIAALKNEKSKNLYLQARYGQLPGRGSDPFQALQRDSEALLSDKSKNNLCTPLVDTTGGTAALRPIYDSQLSQLENLIETQKRAQTKLRDQLVATEKKYQKALIDLNEERKKHERDSAQGDDVLLHLEKDREKLKSELEYEKVQYRKIESKLQQVQQELEDQKQLSILQHRAATRLLYDYHAILYSTTSLENHSSQEKIPTKSQSDASLHNNSPSSSIQVTTNQKSISTKPTAIHGSRSPSPLSSQSSLPTVMANGIASSDKTKGASTIAKPKDSLPLHENKYFISVTTPDNGTDKQQQSLHYITSASIIPPMASANMKVSPRNSSSNSSSTSENSNTSSRTTVEHHHHHHHHVIQATPVDSTTTNSINNNIVSVDGEISVNNNNNSSSRRLKPDPPIRRTPEQSYIAKAVVASNTSSSSSVGGSGGTGGGGSNMPSLSILNAVIQLPQQVQQHRILPQPNILVSSYSLMQQQTSLSSSTAGQVIATTVSETEQLSTGKNPSSSSSSSAVYAIPRKILPQQPTSATNTSVKLGPSSNVATSSTSSNNSSRSLPISTPVSGGIGNAHLHHVALIQQSIPSHTMIPQHLTQLKFMPGVSSVSNDMSLAAAAATAAALGNNHNSHPFPTNYVSTKTAGLTTPAQSSSQHSHR